MEFNYLAEKRRMLDSLGRIDGICGGGEGCEICPLSSNRNGWDTVCYNFEIEYPIEATEIVRKWAKEHPRKTRKDVLLEKFPNALTFKEGHPQSCCALLGFCSKCENSDTCEECWNTEVEE